MKCCNINFLLFLFFLTKGTSGQNTCTIALNSTLRLNLKDPSLPSYNSETGRLELCSCPDSSSCSWNTLIASISNGWSWKNVQVACRQLARDTGSSYVGLGNPVFQTTAPNETLLYPSSFACDGTETNLTDCIASPRGDLTNDSTAAYITCLKTVSTGHLRLTGSATQHQGVLEMYLRHTDRWETICSDNFDNTEAVVACKTLGYGTGRVSHISSSTTFRGSEINTDTAVYSVSCGGSERDLDSCFVALSGSTACSSNRPAYVVCTPNATSPGSTRLFTLQTFNDFKRVEILYAGRWGTVCNTEWDITDAKITCNTVRQSSEDAQVPTKFDSIVASQRPLWASGFMCNGTESNLVQCTISNPIGYTPNCNHINDVGIYCGEEDESGGLSGGAIAGIVIGCVVFCCCCCIISGIGIVICCDKTGYEDCDYSCCTSCCRSSHRRRSFSYNRAHDDRAEVRLETFSEPTDDDIDDKEEIPNEEPREDTELSKAPPPSYNDALTMEAAAAEASALPPDYTKEEEPKDEELKDEEPKDEGEGTNDDNEEGEAANPLPYPLITSDPAYPPILNSYSTDI
ncbi:PREDICTED: egg peptide speract receptor-like [Amphimedon queenslandica]|uniref:SRCR domain-containing protein n=1 Tax=Amphimedon queenslandica TaxID=400682 RepID=A0A1X7V279_AMPQE|nr:PREDICTED: egg peptide speract receptor-like [Amphimedon queenslandica]|eukprot:XP_019851047.1 PREDICTED: egg peptide speract receptor-like [Amphimedon queenslandica]